MIVEYNHTDYRLLLQHFAQTLNSSLENNKLELSEQNGSGFMKLVVLPNGLQCLISDYTAHEDIHLNRTRTKEDLFTLRFDEITMTAADSSSPIRSAVFLGSTKYGLPFFVPKGAKVKSLNILFTKEWLEKFVEVEGEGEIIKKYFSLKMSIFTHEEMDMEYRQIFNKILAPNVDAAFEPIVIQNRLMLLLERFFTLTHFKITNTHFNVKWSNDDIKSLEMVKQRLEDDKRFAEEQPGIASLAKLAAMSPSKLKNSFKELFGMPVYQYYQKQRMNYAKTQLLLKKQTVRDVGERVGYSNLSNFAKAFKKAFDQLPSDLLGRDSS